MSDNQWYFDLVDECSRECKNVDIDNGMPEHARYLIMKLFESSNHSVKLYSGCLKQLKGEEKVEVFAWPDLVSAAVNFLSKSGSKLEILVERCIDGGTENKFIKAITSDDIKGAVEIKQVGRIKMSSHFIVSDSKGYRLEVDDKEVTAIANFNDPENAVSYSDLFTEVFQQSKVTSV